MSYIAMLIYLKWVKIKYQSLNKAIDVKAISEHAVSTKAILCFLKRILFNSSRSYLLKLLFLPHQSKMAAKSEPRRLRTPYDASATVRIQIL